MDPVQRGRMWALHTLHLCISINLWYNVVKDLVSGWNASEGFMWSRLKGHRYHRQHDKLDYCLDIRKKKSVHFVMSTWMILLFLQIPDWIRSEIDLSSSA